VRLSGRIETPWAIAPRQRLWCSVEKLTFSEPVSPHTVTALYNQ
jgi:hypothetical protein